MQKVLILLIFLSFNFYALSLNLQKNPPPYPLEYYCILTVIKNTTGELAFSGRYWYDWNHQKERLDIKADKALNRHVWRFDLKIKYTITQTGSGFSCTKEDLVQTMVPPLDLRNFVYFGNVSLWGEICDHFEIYPEQDYPFQYWTIIRNGQPSQKYENWNDIRTTWLYMQTSPIEPDTFEPPNGVQCKQIPIGQSTLTMKHLLKGKLLNNIH